MGIKTILNQKTACISSIAVQAVSGYSDNGR